MPKHLFLILALLGLVLPDAHAQVSPEAGGAFRFDGFSSYVDTRVSAHIKYFTVMAWVKSPNGPVFAQSNGPVHYEDNFQFNWNHVQANNQGNVLMKDSTGRYGVATFGPLEGNRWYHLAATYDGDTLRSFKNGRPIAKQGGLVGPAKQETRGTLKIGRHATISNSYNHFEGDVDEVRIYNRALPGDSIALQMHHPVESAALGLAYYWQGNDAGTDSTLNAATGRRGAKLISRPLRVASTIPYGPGESEIVTTQAGMGASPGNGLIMTLTRGFDGQPDGKLLATRIDHAPPLALQQITMPPLADTIYRDAYWVLNPLNGVAPRFARAVFQVNTSPLSGMPVLYAGQVGEAEHYVRTGAGYLPTGANTHFDSVGYGTLVLANLASITVSNRPKVQADGFISHSGAEYQLHLPAGSYQLSVRSVDGRLVMPMQRQTSGNPIDLPSHNLLKGLYLIQIESAQGPQIIKWVVE